MVKQNPITGKNVICFTIIDRHPVSVELRGGIRAARIKPRGLTLGILSAVLGFLLQSFFDNNLYSLQLSVLFWVMIGILWAIINYLKQQSLR